MRSCPECTATYPDDYAICPKDGAPLYETTLWQIGTVVRGKYRIQARLGEGGMAVVYKAHHELLDELRALKVIKPELARDAEFMSRFRNEAIMARKLNHPNAVRVDDLDIAEDGLPFIAMELVVGDTLKTLIERIGPMPVSLVLDVALHICDALDSAHKLDLVHRDIKPENIVLVAQREGPPVAKILDFGISRLREETAGSKGLTQTGMVIGTPEYMSPEQALGKRGQRNRRPLRSLLAGHRHVPDVDGRTAFQGGYYGGDDPATSQDYTHAAPPFETAIGHSGIRFRHRYEGAGKGPRETLCHWGGDGRRHQEGAWQHHARLTQDRLEDFEQHNGIVRRGNCLA